jgi:ABC-2 type transport system permease protein
MFMRRIFHIFWREYWGNITRRSYLIFTFGFPIFMTSVPIIGGFALALAMGLALPRTDPRPIGVVDQPGLLAEAQTRPNKPVEINFFADTQTATEALRQGEIQAYYNLQPDYWESGEITLIYKVAPTEQVDNMVIDWVRQQVRAKAPPEVLNRFDRGPTITHHGLESASTFTNMDIIEPVIVYLILYFVRLAGSFTASYMFDSIASEAQDRTLEILITAVSPFQFVTGKLLGLLAVGLTQIGTWGGAILVFAIGGSWLLDVDLLGFLLGWEHLGLMITVLLATYLMDQILAAAMGLLRVSGGAGNLLFATINSVVGISLIYAAYFIPRNPDTPLAVATTLFPVTAPLVLLIRVVVSEVPAWQIILSQVLLWGTNVLGLFWLRRLLKVNLVANTTPFSMRAWLRERLIGMHKLAFLGQKS